MGTRLSSTQGRLFEIFLFLLKLVILSFPLYIILSFEGILLPLQEMVSGNVAFILRMLGFEVSRNGFFLKAGDMAFLITEDCTGWKSMMFFLALVIAVPGVRMKKRVWGFVAGIPAIYAGNLFRILVMIFVLKFYGYETAEAVHNYLWQAGLILLVVFLWVLWMLWAGKMEITFLKRFPKLIKPR